MHGSLTQEDYAVVREDEKTNNNCFASVDPSEERTACKCTVRRATYYYE